MKLLVDMNLSPRWIGFAGSQAPAWEPSPGSSSFPSHPPSPHKSAIMPGSRYRVQCDPCPHFLTATINHWLPLFTRTETVNIVLDYIHQNPVKRGLCGSTGTALVPKLELGNQTSARNYAGQEGLIEVIRAW